MARSSDEPEIIWVAEATEEHPRHGGADLIELNDGSIFMSKMLIHKSNLKWQAGDDAPSDLITLVSRDGGRTWGEHQVFLKPGPDETAAYTPGFLRLRDGSILFRYEMYHHFVKDEPISVSGYSCISRDECKTFSDPVTIFDRSSHHGGSQGDIRQLSTGRIIVPVMDIRGTALQDDGEGLSPSNMCYSGCFYSDDDGRTWQESEKYVYLSMRGSMEPKVEELKDGRLIMVMRTQLGSVFKSYSEDGGRTWLNAQTTGLHAPESCPGLIRNHERGDLLLIYNDSPYDPQFDHYGVRSPFTIAKSSDEGETWQKLKDIETDPEWEFTNPAMIITSRRKLLLAYEASKYESLKHPGKLGRTLMDLKLAIIDLDWLYS